MTTLKEILLRQDRRAQLIRDCCEILDAEVAGKSGVKGLVIKGGFKAMKTLKPGMIADAIAGLIDDFVARLEPFWSDFQRRGDGQPLRAVIMQQRSDVANALLGITDDRARTSKNRPLKKIYAKLRPLAQRNVEDALPRVAELVERYQRMP